MIIRHMNENRVFWDFVIIILAVYNSFALPMEISFRPYWLMNDTTSIVNSVIDLMFAIDILISFRTTYICPDTGAEITGGWEIARNYIRGRFIFDLLSTIPFDKLQKSYEL